MQQLKTSDIPQIREEILEDQGGLCLVCMEPPVRSVLDHHHTKRIKGSGQVRGVICSNCNVFLAKIENNASRYGVKDIPSTLRNISKYLEKNPYPYIHPSEKPQPRRLMKSSYNELYSVATDKIPSYPNSERYTKALEEAFNKYGVTPRFYK
jgi:hypothetical protein